MIENISNSGLYAQIPASSGLHRKPSTRVLAMGENDRTAGSMPIWRAPASPGQQVAQALSAAQTGRSSLENTLSYSHAGAEGVAPDQEFGFDDLVDMVNPLQHIPLVGHVYREVTGDEIKPIGKIIGGAVFGGPAGAAVGLVDAAVAAETGDDLAGNAIKLAMGVPIKARQASTTDDPQERLAQASQIAAVDLPVTLLAFTDTGRRSDIIMQRVMIARAPDATSPKTPVYRQDDWKIAAMTQTPAQTSHALFDEGRRYNG